MFPRRPTSPLRHPQLVTLVIVGNVIPLYAVTLLQKLRIMCLNYYQGHQRLFKDKRNTDFSIITIEHEDVQTQIPSQSIVKVPATNRTSITIFLNHTGQPCHFITNQKAQFSPSACTNLSKRYIYRFTSAKKENPNTYITCIPKKKTQIHKHSYETHT